MKNATSQSYDGSAREIQNPYLNGMPAVLGLTGLCLAGLAFAGWMIDRGLWPQPVIWIAATPFALFAFMTIVIWLVGRARVGAMEAFLRSDRPLLRWTYAEDEWHDMREAQWHEAEGDWKIQFGCLTFLFGVVGLLVGAMIAGGETSLDGFSLDTLSEILGVALPWTGGGVLVGAAIGAVVSGGNYLAERAARRQATPGEIALAENEFFADGQYFREAWGAYVDSVTLDASGERPLLTIVTQHPWRRPHEDTWEIEVPRRRIREVEQILPRITPRRAE